MPRKEATKKRSSRSNVLVSADGKERLVIKQARSRGRKKPAMLSEHYQQAKFITWCRETAELQENPVIREALYWLHAIPNGFLKTANARITAHAEGVQSGIHDTFLACPEQAGPSKRAWLSRASAAGHHGFYIEFKRPGEKMSPNQVRFAQYLAGVNYKTMVAFSWQEAATAVVEYLRLAPGTYPVIGEPEYLAYRRIASRSAPSRKGQSARI